MRWTKGGDMRDQFVGDNGDLGKYVAFKALAANDPAGVVWYARPDSAGASASHGSRRTYEGKTARAQHLRDIDPAITSALRRVSRPGRSMERAARPAALWPTQMSHPGDHFLKELRPHWRMGWFADALHQLGGKALVLFDPDNGVAPPDRVTGAHATAEEVLRFLASGSSLVVVQYAGRTRNALASICEQLTDELSDAGHSPAPFALRWMSDGPSGFLIVPASSRARGTLWSRAQSLEADHPAFFTTL